ncbi:hypothetical protein GCM10011349_40160 [Novosphingobium indicum]|uniref:Uncharacterized protein n=1 Tax=Novosphingobium indicum TaxID=462949 RepID=A0ABQ2JYQ8_9SPHN|nr:hypothetical protein GCM10011349_40160 [Novosphingobium indicum]
MFIVASLKLGKEASPPARAASAGVKDRAQPGREAGDGGTDLRSKLEGPSILEAGADPVPDLDLLEERIIHNACPIRPSPGMGSMPMTGLLHGSRVCLYRWDQRKV